MLEQEIYQWLKQGKRHLLLKLKQILEKKTKLGVKMYQVLMDKTLSIFYYETMVKSILINSMVETMKTSRASLAVFKNKIQQWKRQKAISIKNLRWKTWKLKLKYRNWTMTVNLMVWLNWMIEKTTHSSILTYLPRIWIVKLLSKINKITLLLLINNLIETRTKRGN